MKLYSAGQIRDWDRYTIENEPVSSIDLMERAAGMCTKWIRNQPFDNKRFKIFCGKGNNGGDGLAIARHLAFNAIEIAVYILEFGAKGSPDFQANLKRLHDYTRKIYFIQPGVDFPEVAIDDIVIDALFGSGLNKPLEGLTAKLVEHINRSGANVISIDLPSGMFADASSKDNPIVRARTTLTFQTPKLSFFLPENDVFTGNLQVLDIGLHPGYYAGTQTNFQQTGRQLIDAIYRPRNKFAHKGTYGHALMVAGSEGKVGAAILASHACLRVGVGLLSTALPAEAIPILQVALPEAMAVSAEALDEIHWQSYAAVGIGPGLGTSASALSIMESVLANVNYPVVVDADGLNLIGANRGLLDQLPAGSILTPHPKEFERLFGKAADGFERISVSLAQAQRYNIYILVKGHYSFMACPDGSGYFNSTGNPGMATAGSGDVLTGILTGLLAQGYEPKQALLFGVYIHGMAGDFAAANYSQEAMIAGDITRSLPEVFKDFARKQA
ncbi:NAD(P)H-hydrate dehydratase [Segetibacter sp. 3557_3]|uniref:NAD(P)H-hydrate dehydratase n=1 Tax=Segetibacter sp. 3557_3 TaxID=2547429 RepID=UPI001058FE32|nr:NAD(P)H-hydrate dehydratase [Segetibacter sp. 3557_3]TDH28884.1 NAD(P)H-hydrate dehydratase [Segetibacter sp. 3557_3]